MINAIVACDLNNGIGLNGSIPWFFKQDMIFFKKMTEFKTIVMGKKTWESLNNKPLKKRNNIVLTTKNDIEFPNNVMVYNNFEDVVNIYEDIYVIGGENLYKMALEHKNFKTLYLTRIVNKYKCDKFFPKIPNHFTKTTINRIFENNTELIFEKYMNELYNPISINKIQKQLTWKL